MFCTSCGASAADTARFCAKCGASVQTDPNATLLHDEPVAEANLETFTSDHPPTPAPTPRAPSSASGSRTRPSSPSGSVLTSSDPIGGGRFAPGVMIGGRYRIVALLGRGGMGEVYRAEDLKLSHVLAIKFLPDSLSRDAAALARFHSEVRIARQLAHPNVCRVFDIGEENGIPFLTMEYVDGEDLSSLIRRIGRLPQDKAMEVSRQICAGIAAAHERGVVHRDLKPSNVMLDGSGKARITDFGLAGIAADIQASDVRAGTPAYMAPEQLAGKEVTFKSDIYSLGLVMYEVLTGRRAYNAATLSELVKTREEGTITNPSTLVKDLDPLIERVILRCLEKDPAKRPASALQVAAALPGGDPLAAALAAGETPSPEMVAASGDTEGTHPVLALSCLLAVLLLVGICSFIGIRESGMERMSLPYSPEVLTHKARESLSTLGYTAEPADSVAGFSYDNDYLNYLDNKDHPSGTWNAALVERPGLLNFWYRQSPQEMVANDVASISMTPGVVRFSDPPQTFSGMINLRTDPSGRLLYFQAIPPEKVDQAQPVSASLPAPDWQPLFSAAGLAMSDFHPAPPAWNSLASSDTRAAWDGTWPDTSQPLHIEAAAWRGKPVFFQLAGPWTTPSRMPPPEQTGSARAGQIFGVCFAFLLIGGGIWLAYRNYARGKGDRRGAWRLAQVVFAVELLLFFLWAHLSFAQSFFGLLAMALSTSLLFSAILWTLYLALEPYVRSKWPQTIVSWTRLLSGKLRDPLVGRDILFGTVLGTIWVFVFFFGYFFDIRVGEQPLLPALDILQGARSAAGLWLGNALSGVFGVLAFFFVLIFLRVVVRNRWLAAALFVLLFTLPKYFASHHPLIDTPIWIVIYGISAFAVVRFGLLTLAAAVFTANLLLNLPYTLNWSRWYAGTFWCVLLSVVALAAWGYYSSLAGKRLLKEDFFD
jgi:serine/threonine protein kinase